MGMGGYERFWANTVISGQPKALGSLLVMMHTRKRPVPRCLVWKLSLFEAEMGLTLGVVAGIQLMKEIKVAHSQIPGFKTA